MVDVKRQPGDGYRGFFAVDIDLPVRERLLQAQAILKARSWAQNVSWSRTENLHLTLRFMGNRTYHDFEGWVAALTPKLAQLQSFEVCIDGIGVFPNTQRPIAIAALIRQSSALETLVEIVESSVQRQVLPRRHDYRGHITLGRCQRGFSHHVEQPCLSYTDELTIEAVCLVESQMKANGLAYQVRAHMPLAK